MIRLALALLVFLSANQAFASASGYVTGRVTFYNEQIGYTNNPGPVDWYKSSEFQTPQPLRGVRVELRNQSFGTLLGYGYTDINGYYGISWWSAQTVTTGFIRIVWSDNGRLKVTDEAGGQWYTDFDITALTNGTTAATPQGWTHYQVGSPTVQFPWANIYDAAWRMWYYALSYSGVVASNLFNKPIRWPSAQCPTSCGTASGVHLDGGGSTPYASPTRTSHELGHVAQYLSAQQQTPNFCLKMAYPATSSGGAWNHDTPEWTCAAYQEGLASFLATVSRHWYNSTLATECRPSDTGICNLDVESSAGPSCIAVAERRWPLTTQRFFWDVYDTANDSEADTQEYAQIIVNHRNFSPGLGNRKREEWSNGAGNLSGGQPVETGLAAFDGASAGDWWQNYNTNYSVLLQSYARNCNQQYD